MTSAKHQPVLPQTPASRVSGWNCGPALPQIIRQLPRFDPVRIAETERHIVPASASSRSTNTGNLKVRLTSGMTPRIGVSEDSDFIGASCVASTVAGLKSHRLITSHHDLAAARSLPSVSCDVTIELSVHNTRRIIATSERIVRGNAPNIGGSHEKRNVDQCSPAGREPDWRC